MIPKHWAGWAAFRAASRQHWRLILTGSAIALLFLSFNWAETCGLAGCPSAASIQAFRPSEGSRVLDRSGRTLGRLTYVRRINVPLARAPRQGRRAIISVGGPRV